MRILSVNSVPDDNSREISARENLRCVWMTAGILSYQLCDRELDCDQCPLDAALRMHFSRPRDVVHAGETEHPKNVSYSRNHCWIALPEGGRARVGVEPGLAAALGSLKAVVLPALGEKIRHGEWCAWIVLEGGTFPLRAPLSGTITAVNPRLSEQPSSLSASPYQDGWLFEVDVKADEPVRAHLMARRDAERLFANDVQRFRDRLKASVDNSAAGVGATLNDGGEFVGDAAAMLGGKRYIEIIREEFRC
jgi:glycine cleavage system H protein